MVAPFVDTLRVDVSSFSVVRQWFDESRVLELAAEAGSADTFARLISAAVAGTELPSYLAELAAMEAHCYKLEHELISFNPFPEQLTINPTVKLFNNRWAHLATLFDPPHRQSKPVIGDEQVLVWLAPGSTQPVARPVRDGDLLAMKIGAEQLSIEEVAELGSTTIAAVNTVLLNGLEAGIVLGPKPKLVRPSYFPSNKSDSSEDSVPEIFESTRVFALQWHITQACDLHCRHCYDRSDTASLALHQEIEILDSFREFCSAHQVFGQISFTGGNPLLHDHFFHLYREASERGFFLGILGNPATREHLDELCAIQPPAFYQMSLEGLEHHNDHIRGPGHFKKVMAFLDRLREAKIYSKIMLTLTRENLEQVIPLGTFLQNRTDLFTFNRLSLIGEGANLIMADPADFEAFLENYLDAAKTHDVIELKDNLFNIILDQRGAPLFGGCTGYGCGAAFNFVSVLATGEVHACRKFPSPIGDLTRQTLNDIYHSEPAERYRQGPDDCRSCNLSMVCRGCMAATHSYGLDVFGDKDPFCFKEN